MRTRCLLISRRLRLLCPCFSSQRQYPFLLQDDCIQTDNGSEFLKHFAQSCLDNDFVHFFNYPRHPQSNGHIERFNRTSQEQFVDWYTDSLDDPDVFNRSLMNYLIWYNTEKPHRAIGKMPPLRYYLEKFATPEKSNMLWPLHYRHLYPLRDRRREIEDYC